MRIGAYKSGGYGDMADYLVLLASVRQKHPDAHISAYCRMSSPEVFDPYIRLLNAPKGICDEAFCYPDESHPFGDSGFLRHQARQFDYFYDFRPYVGRCYRGDEAAISLDYPDAFRSVGSHWHPLWGKYYNHPLSQYQNVLQDDCPGMSHLQITAQSCDLPMPDWDAVDIDLPSVDPPGGDWVSVNLGSAGGMVQTKSWGVGSWQTVVDALDCEAIQLGTNREPRLKRVRHVFDSPLMTFLGWLRASPLHVAIENGSVRLRRLVTNQPSVVLFGPTAPSMFGIKGNVVVHADVCRPCFWLTKEWMTECPRAIKNDVTENIKALWGDRLPQSGHYDRICMRSITPETVIDEVDRCLENLT